MLRRVTNIILHLWNDAESFIEQKIQMVSGKEKKGGGGVSKWNNYILCPVFLLGSREIVTEIVLDKSNRIRKCG